MDLKSKIRNKIPKYGILGNYSKIQTIENQLLRFSGTHLAIGFASKTNGNIISVSAGGIYGVPVKNSNK